MKAISLVQNILIMFLPKNPLICLSAIALLFFPAFVYKAKAQKQKPNIIFILSDDIGYKTLTVNGGTNYSTPSFDKMAKQGMNFKECHASPVCSPSRYLLLTGKYNFRNYIQFGSMDASQKTIGNMLKDAGYKTACFGKWQLDGGDASIRAFGFDNYCVFLPFPNLNEEPPKYKNPVLYTNGAFISPELTLNEYGPDIFADSAINFIEKNKDTSFFIYYPMVLAHKPFQPTPDDPDFATWNSNESDTAYYPSMIKYMDKLVGKLLKKVNDVGIANNTIIIFTGDNGTPGIISKGGGDDDKRTGKATTLESGLTVPMIAWWPGKIAPGSVNNDLIGFTDFLPTLADIANIPVPDYGPLDGVSFAPRLTGDPGTPREWLYYHYDPHPGEEGDSATRWAQTVRYKLYDTSSANNTLLFYDVKNDTNQTQPIPDNLLTNKQAAIKQQLLDVINSYVAQGTAVLGNPEVLLITDSSATAESSIGINGGSTISASGIVWGKQHNPVLSSGNHTSENAYSGKFLSFLEGLNANTTYYVRTYATNNAGTSYSKEITVITPPVAPVCKAATNIKNIKFTANWKTVNSADNYRIDVSEQPLFYIPTPASATQGFDSGAVSVDGWVLDKELVTDTVNFGKASPSILFKNSNRHILSAQYNGPATKLSFWIKGYNNNSGSLLVEGFNGLSWVVIDTIININKTAVTKIYDSTSSPALGSDLIQFRFSYTRTKGNLAIDDVKVKYTYPNPDFVPGYEDLFVSGNSQIVSGLTINKKYYYRARSQNINGTSGNSNTIAVTTGSQALNEFENLSQANREREMVTTVFPNPANDEFTLTVKPNNKEPVSIIVTDLYGNEVYRSASRVNDKYVFGKNFPAGTYLLQIRQGKVTKTIKLIKSGK